MIQIFMVCFLATIVLLFMKLIGVITWSFLVVFSPLIFWLAFLVILIILSMFIMSDSVDNNNNNNN
jgi:hypothetical protein